MQRKACIATQNTSSFRRLYCDRSIISSKASSAQSAIVWLLFQLPAILFFVFLRPSRSYLRLLPLFPVIPIIPSIFPSKLFLRTKYLHKMWRIQLTFLLLVVFRNSFSSLALCNTSFFTRLVQLIFYPLLQHHISELSRYFSSALRSVQVSVSYITTLKM